MARKEESGFRNKKIRGEAVRYFMINGAILETYGLTRGCDGCAAKAAGRTVRRGQSKDCRSRLEEEMRKTGDEQGILRKHR